MKICIFIPKLNGGGAEKAAICQANALSNAGYKVSLLVLDPKAPMTPVNDNVKIITLCKKMRFAVLALPIYLFREKPEIIISHLSVANFICSLVSIFFKKTYSIIKLWFKGEEINDLEQLNSNTILENSTPIYKKHQ